MNQYKFHSTSLSYSALDVSLNKAELIPKIESGEVDHLDFTAKVFSGGKNRNYYRFRDEELSFFAPSFAGRPFLRNHDELDIESRDGRSTS